MNGLSLHAPRRLFDPGPELAVGCGALRFEPAQFDEHVDS